MNYTRRFSLKKHLQELNISVVGVGRLGSVEVPAVIEQTNFIRTKIVLIPCGAWFHIHNFCGSG